MKGNVLVLLVAVALSACAPTTKWANVDSGMVAAEREKQMDLALEMIAKDQTRLNDVANGVLAGALGLCGEKVKPRFEVAWMAADMVSGPMAEATSRRYKLQGNTPVLTYVGTGGPGQKAGLRVGDEVAAINGTSVTSGKKMGEMVTTFMDDKSRWPIRFTVLRGGKVLELHLTPRAACDYPVELADQDVVNAYADGKKIYVTRGMMRFINEDRELALVISHELAHNTMGHINKKMGNALLGSVVDVLAAAYGVNTQGAFGKMAGNAYSQDFEMEADYVGLYAMALSGAEVDGVANFWRRMAAANPGSIGRQGYFASHPSSPERYLAIEKAAEEIKAKRLAGKALRPEQKEEQQVSRVE